MKQIFFWNSCFFDNPVDVDNLISGSSAVSKSSLNIWKFSVHVQCFLRPRWLHPPRCLILGEWSHHCSPSKMSDSWWVINTHHRCIWVIKTLLVLFCVFLSASSQYLLVLLGHTISVLYCAHLCMKCSLGISDFLDEISNLSHSVVFNLFLFIVDLERLSYLSLLLFGSLHSNGYIIPFLLCLLLLLVSQLFVKPPQTTILHFCISFSWVWF